MNVRLIPPVLRRPDVIDITGLSRASVDRLEASGEFPRRFHLSTTGRAVAWNGAEVAAWIEQRTASRTDRR